MTDERYQRQIDVFGPDGQEKLRKSRVAVVGGNLLADFTLAALASLGVGTLFPVAYERTAKRSLIPFDKDIGSYKKFFRAFNEEMEVYPMRANIASKASVALLPYADVIVDVTDDQASKYIVGTHAKEKGHALLGYASDRFAHVIHANHTNNLDSIVAGYKPVPDNVVTCEITAGLLADEIRKVLLPNPGQRMKNTTLAHKYVERQHTAKTAVIGAGALGTWVGIGLALMDIPATIIDNDTVDVTNLNRQFLYYDAVGKSKAETLAKKLSGFGPRFSGRNERFEGKLDERYELLVSCVDNLLTRSLLNRIAVNDQVPLVNGGTDPRSGNVEAYVPGITGCVACQGGVPEKVIEETRASCTQQGESSTVISNLVVSGLMLKTIGELFGNDLKGGKFIYSSEAGVVRINVRPMHGCGCYIDPNKKSDETGRYNYGKQNQSCAGT